MSISATNSATPSLQSVLLSVRLAQARRDVDQAEAKAQDLRTQADAAQNQAQQSRGRVSDLSQRSRQTDPTYQTQLQAGQSALTAKPQGQTSGRFVNFSA